jgi:hypothetical protein
MSGRCLDFSVGPDQPVSGLWTFAAVGSKLNIRFFVASEMSGFKLVTLQAPGLWESGNPASFPRLSRAAVCEHPYRFLDAGAISQWNWGISDCLEIRIFVFF